MNSFHPDPSQATGAPAAAHTRVRADEDIAVGELLRQARQRRGLTLQQVAQNTKIPLRQLQALERDEFSALPGGMYRRAQVRAYAEAVGLDRNVALAGLDRALDGAMPRTASGVQAPVPPKRFASSRTRVSIAGGMVVTAAVIALATWARQPAAEDSASSAAPVSPPASSVVPALYAPNHAVAATSGNTIEPVSAASRQRTEPASVQPVSNGQAQAEPSDGAPAAASGAESQLMVMTEPAGARVTVDGIGWGVTPVTIHYLTPGAKRVRVTREGYLAEERLVQVGAAVRTLTLRIPLRNAESSDR